MLRAVPSENPRPLPSEPPEGSRTRERLLERVFESSADAIVAASLDGTLLLFNAAASQIFGYAPGEVIGTSVERFYPPGGAQAVMRAIRDEGLGGPGRVVGLRVEMLARDGSARHVELTAALVLEEGVPIATVGVFSDLRERLAMEARLREAESTLREREKQVALAELAGATAHELNQPLTSIVAYAALLERRAKGDPELAQMAEIIASEAERLANVVRKIGSITRYETRGYVGEAQILDLERSTAAASEGDELLGARGLLR